MAKNPALPLFTDAYLSDTRHLTTLQLGAYLLLLITAWRSHDCAVPDDDLYLAKVTGTDRRTWKANKDIVMSFWQLNDQQRWVQGRLLDERNFVAQKRIKNVRAAEAGALKRKNRDAADAQPDASVSSAPTPTPTTEAKASYAAEEAPKDGEPDRYAFSGSIIKLNQPDLDTWSKTYLAIPDITAKLRTLDHWAAQKGITDWFVRVSGALNRKHQEILAGKKTAGGKTGNGGSMRALRQAHQNRRAE